ncbi:MAG: rRNA maturation RNase YbeY [Gemmatimonadetes bacterium]|nr:rRNA maturation RNase YbeY [Gemmatimonadota bacterium]
MSTTRVSVQVEGVRTSVSRARLAAAVAAVLRAERAGPALVSVTLVTRRRIAAMNRRHLGHTGPTDVISFAFNDPAGAVIGDVYVSPEVAAENARRFGRPVREELVRLVVHGTLHVLGHDHPVDAAREGSPMWRRQEALVHRVLAR